MASAPNLIQRRVDKYDGQSIFIDGEEVYELGNYLGGGASGSVYQAIDSVTERPVAIKILNPVGFKLFPSGQLGKCTTLNKGHPLSLEQCSGKLPYNMENIWWLYHQPSRQILAAYEDPQRGQLRELTLPKCVEIWGWYPFGDVQLPVEVEDKQNMSGNVCFIDGQSKALPVVAPKYLKWLRSRQSICREMASMMQLGEHRNITKLYEVLELVQDSKTTLFLVLELVTGGELFDRMKVGHGNSEESGRKYFAQLLSGIEYCHEKGVCHRDLKPENLLLSDSSDNGILKMADFGLSAVMFAAGDESLMGGSFDAGERNLSDENKANSPQFGDSLTANPNPALLGYHINKSLQDSHLAEGSPVKRLRSVVGSPHYVPPEVTADSSGYDGRKVDMWSAGVILYGILTGSLPFGRDLGTCQRYRRFQKWMYDNGAIISSGKSPAMYPSWLFPQHMSSAAKSLIVQLLHPDPDSRLTASEALKHPWIVGTRKSSTASSAPPLPPTLANRSRQRVGAIPSPRSPSGGTNTTLHRLDTPVPILQAISPSLSVVSTSSYSTPAFQSPSPPLPVRVPDMSALSLEDSNQSPSGQENVFALGDVGSPEGQLVCVDEDEEECTEVFAKEAKDSDSALDMLVGLEMGLSHSSVVSDELGRVGCTSEWHREMETDADNQC